MQWSKWLPGARALVLLRRVGKALEEANDLERERLSLEFPAWRGKGSKKGPKIVEIGVADPKEWNSKWRKDQGLED